MLSHKKYNELATRFAECVTDEDTMERLLEAVKIVLNYSPDKSTYNRATYEKVKQRRQETGDTSWAEYNRRYYHEHKADLNKKRLEHYHKTKANAIAGSETT